MLSVPRLKILREIAATGSFSAAADSLSYTQSAVSQAIAALEAEAGAALLERDRRGVRPTPAGAALIEHAGAVLSRLEAAQEEVAAIAGGRLGRLRIASFPTAGATLIPLAVSTFREAHPDVELSLAEGEPEDIAPRLRSGEFDLALLFEFTGERRLVSGDGRAELLTDPMRLALPAGHPLAERDSVRLEDLRDQAWVQTSAASPCARHVVRSCLAAGFEPTVSFESDDYQTVQGLVAAGVGVALIPQLALTTVRSDVVVRELSGRSSPARTVLAGVRRGAHSPPAAAMLDVLRTTARAYGYAEGSPDPSAG